MFENFRGVYLACIIYHEDKVLVTNEDFLPVIEIDETYPACIYTDYHWLMKVCVFFFYFLNIFVPYNKILNVRWHALGTMSKVCEVIWKKTHHRQFTLEQNCSQLLHKCNPLCASKI